MEDKKTALLITYYWPPAGGAGVHRWLRLSNYFIENGWKLHVYCPENAEWPIIDNELQKQVTSDLTIIRKSIFEPHKYLGKKNNPNVSGGLTRNSKSSIIQKLIIWTRGNLFIPDARVFWIRPSFRFLKKYLNEHPEITTIISTGPPHSLHVIGQKLKKERPKIKWVADFRDPWTDIDFYQELLPGKWADKRQHNLEKKCLQEADEIVTISDNCAEGLSKIGQRKVEVITNGYNFPYFDEEKIDLDSKFTIAHFGSMSFPRNPEILWNVLSDICKENSSFKNDLLVNLIGPVDFTIFERLIIHQLERNYKYIALVTHQESIQMQRASQIMLLVANRTGNVKGILTGKFFEYLGAKRPILAIGEADSDLETAMNLTQCGKFISYDDYSTTRTEILKWYDLFQENKLECNSINLDMYSSQSLAKKYCALLDSLL